MAQNRAGHLSQSSAMIKTAIALCCLMLCVVLLPSCATTGLHTKPAVQSYQQTNVRSYAAYDPGQRTLKVMTLNIAHGRGDSFHQLLQGSDTTLSNLDTIATLLKNTDADVVALQEADGPSFWSGNFNHVEYLARQAAFRQSVRAAHVDGIGLSYGTALIANLDLSEAEAITFEPGLLPVPKGFLVSTITWPGKPCVAIDVISVHLDFASHSSRKKQASELIGKLRDRNRPVIVMGDLNTEWQLETSAVRYLADKLELVAYSPGSNDLSTFPAFAERLDWILVSPELQFRSYRVIPDIVSDHRGVVAELALDEDSQKTAQSSECAVAGLSL
jgi:endonuclease/exonuclease/phosphatase family metal-dependent hydrolase